jgi:hypothetical protein
VAEIGVPTDIHGPVASHWQTLSHNVLSSSPRHDGSSSVKMKGICVIDIDGIYDYHCL